MKLLTILVFTLIYACGEPQDSRSLAQVLGSEEEESNYWQTFSLGDKSLVYSRESTITSGCDPSELEQAYKSFKYLYFDNQCRKANVAITEEEDTKGINDSYIKITIPKSLSFDEKVIEYYHRTGNNYMQFVDRKNGPKPYYALDTKYYCYLFLGEVQVENGASVLDSHLIFSTTDKLDAYENFKAGDIVSVSTIGTFCDAIGEDGP